MKRSIVSMRSRSAPGAVASAPPRLALLALLAWLGTGGVYLRGKNLNVERRSGINLDVEMMTVEGGSGWRG
jgi:hypothetical protein